MRVSFDKTVAQVRRKLGAKRRILPTMNATLIPPPRLPAPGQRSGLRMVRDVLLSPFAAVHVLAFGALFVGVSRASLLCCVALYIVRMFGVTAGYHRYFSHRTFKTSRVGQFLLACLAQSSAQKGVLWWAAHHRGHHKYSDHVGDVHSPVQRGFWYAHVGWIFDDTEDTDLTKVRDLAKYPELRWLNQFWYVPPALLAAGVWYALGFSGFCVGFCLSTVLLWHGTFCVNSLAHLWGSRRYATADASRNNVWIALVTLGEGWHNNHHNYMGSVRQGFFWWEFDPTYYTIKCLSWLGITWDLRQPPRAKLTAVA